MMNGTNQLPYIDYSIINIISDLDDEAFISFENKASDVAVLPQEIEKKFKQKILRVTREKAKNAFQILGCKASVAASLSSKILEHFQNSANSLNFEQAESLKSRHLLYTTRDKFLGILRKYLHEHSLTKEQNIFDFELAIDIIDQNKSLIVLLGGTSGTGKSTVASLLASRFGISTVLSSDSVRHVMRNFMSTEECPILFASTYEVGSKMKFEEDVPEKKRTVIGFTEQAQLIQNRMESVLFYFSLVTF
jgi:2-phosphoglycerate kinase